MAFGHSIHSLPASSQHIVNVQERLLKIQKDKQSTLMHNSSIASNNNSKIINSVDEGQFSSFLLYRNIKSQPKLCSKEEIRMEKFKKKKEITDLDTSQNKIVSFALPTLPTSARSNRSVESKYKIRSRIPKENKSLSLIHSPLPSPKKPSHPQSLDQSAILGPLLGLHTPTRTRSILPRTHPVHKLSRILNPSSMLNHPVSPHPLPVQAAQREGQYSILSSTFKIHTARGGRYRRVAIPNQHLNDYYSPLQFEGRRKLRIALITVLASIILQKELLRIRIDIRNQRMVSSEPQDIISRDIIELISSELVALSEIGVDYGHSVVESVGDDKGELERIREEKERVRKIKVAQLNKLKIMEFQKARKLAKATKEQPVLSPRTQSLTKLNIKEFEEPSLSITNLEQITQFLPNLQDLPSPTLPSSPRIFTIPSPMPRLVDNRYHSPWMDMIDKANRVDSPLEVETLGYYVIVGIDDDPNPPVINEEEGYNGEYYVPVVSLPPPPAVIAQEVKPNLYPYLTGDTLSTAQAALHFFTHLSLDTHRDHTLDPSTHPPIPEDSIDDTNPHYYYSTDLYTQSFPILTALYSPNYHIQLKDYHTFIQSRQSRQI